MPSSSWDLVAGCPSSRWGCGLRPGGWDWDGLVDLTYKVGLDHYVVPKVTELGKFIDLLQFVFFAFSASSHKYSLQGIYFRIYMK